MRRALAFAVVVAVLLSSGIAAQAGIVGSEGRCRMRLIERETRIRVRFVMRTNTPNRDWRVKILDEQRRVFHGVFTTDADGDFVMRTVIRRRPGFRRYEGRAAEIGTGVVCRVVLRT
jgi:hypothetical protein